MKVSDGNANGPHWKWQLISVVGCVKTFKTFINIVSDRCPIAQIEKVFMRRLTSVEIHITNNEPRVLLCIFVVGNKSLDMDERFLTISQNDCMRYVFSVQWYWNSVWWFVWSAASWTMEGARAQKFRRNYLLKLTNCIEIGQCFSNCRSWSRATWDDSISHISSTISVEKKTKTKNWPVLSCKRFLHDFILPHVVWPSSSAPFHIYLLSIIFSWNIYFRQLEFLFFCTLISTLIDSELSLPTEKLENGCDEHAFCLFSVPG